MANARTIIVRPAAAKDVTDLLRLTEAYLDFYRVERPPSHRIVRFLTMLRTNPQRGSQFLARTAGGDAVGFATLLLSYDTLILARVAIVNDIYVSPAFRRRGVGRALLQACRRHAHRRRAGRLEWVTANDNAAAQTFYDRFGATRSRWVSYEISTT